MFFIKRVSSFKKSSANLSHYNFNLVFLNFIFPNVGRTLCNIADNGPCITNMWDTHTYL